MSVMPRLTDLFARKGEAAPTPFAGQAETERTFAARRRLVLVTADERSPFASPQSAQSATGAAASGLRQGGRAAGRRLRFTFRLKPSLHARLVAAAAAAGCSRQRFLETALTAYLEREEER